MNQAQIMTDIASNGMMSLLELIGGSDTSDPNSGGLIGALTGSMTDTQVDAFAEKFMDLYNSVVSSTRYGGGSLLDGGTNATRTFRLGGDDGAATNPAALTLTVTIPNLSSGASGAAEALSNLITAGITDANRDDVLAAAEALQTVIAGHVGTLGGNQSIVAMNQRLLDSRLTTLTAAEGRISNTDIALESSRMARAELLAQNAMNSIMYNRRFAAFSVGSLFG